MALMSLQPGKEGASMSIWKSSKKVFYTKKRESPGQTRGQENVSVTSLGSVCSKGEDDVIHRPLRKTRGICSQ